MFSNFVSRHETANRQEPTEPIKGERSARIRSARLGTAAIALALLLGACGSSDSAGGDDSSSASDVAAPVVVAANDLGDILVDDNGMTLYGFTNDSKGTSVCEGGCAEAWPPVLVDSAELPAGLDSGVFSVIARSDGTHQLQAGSWPLYLFASDAAAGDAFGQGSGDVWYVVDAKGGLIK